jgi:hypothetical protein
LLSLNDGFILILIDAKPNGECPSEGENGEASQDKRLGYTTKARSSNSIQDSVDVYTAFTVIGILAPRSKNDVLDWALLSRNDSPCRRWTTHSRTSTRDSHHGGGPGKVPNMDDSAGHATE